MLAKVITKERVSALGIAPHGFLWDPPQHQYTTRRERADRTLIIGYNTVVQH